MMVEEDKEVQLEVEDLLLQLENPDQGIHKRYVSVSIEGFWFFFK